MKKTTKVSLIAFVSLIILYKFLSVFFTDVTFQADMETKLSTSFYEKIQYEKCSENQQKKDLTVNFTYKFPFVNFNGKLVVIDIKNREGEDQENILFSGRYEDKIIIKNLCYSDKNEASLYRNLKFQFNDENAVYWFYSDTETKGYPFLKYDEVTIKIDSFSIYPSYPYHMTPLK